MANNQTFPWGLFLSTISIVTATAIPNKFWVHPPGRYQERAFTEKCQNGFLGGVLLKENVESTMKERVEIYV